MKSFAVILKSLVLALLLSTNAHALEKVNINTASAAELDRVLVNVGPSKAEAIVEHRQANGPFKSAEELALVKGIGLKTVERNRDL
ncbi:MAG TPA: competence protein ComEA, partial [Xanthomonadaceae bacterium]|nr:competence protein ComEA [Xanthomonadaceae bacterium]